MGIAAAHRCSMWSTEHGSIARGSGLLKDGTKASIGAGRKLMSTVPRLEAATGAGAR